MAKVIVLILLIFTILVVGWSVKTMWSKENNSANIVPQNPQLIINGKSYDIEIASTPAQQQQGLSGRDEIGSDGLLFVFQPAKQAAFWMKDMKFDLDFVWIADGTIVEISPNISAPQSSEEELPIYQPAQSVDSMLEVTAGFASQEGWQVGDKVEREQ